MASFAITVNSKLRTVDVSPDMVEVFTVPSTNAPRGIREPGVPPIAAAVANAVYAATGQRLRKLPLRLS